MSFRNSLDIRDFGGAGGGGSAVLFLTWAKIVAWLVETAPVMDYCRLANREMVLALVRSLGGALAAIPPMALAVVLLHYMKMVMMVGKGW